MKSISSTYAFYFAYVFLWFIACKHSPKNAALPAAAPATDPQDTVVADIMPADLRFRSVFIPGDTLSSQAALMALFPGTYHRFYKEWEIDASIWTCHACKDLLRYPWHEDGGGVQMRTFPSKLRQFTSVAGQLKSMENDSTCIFVFFSTTDQFPPIGRTNSAFLGIGMFLKKDGGWALHRFSPAVYCGGTFAKAHAPQQFLPPLLILQGGNANAAGGTHQYDDLHVFAPDNEGWKEVLFEPDAFCTTMLDDPGLTRWQTQLQLSAGKNKLPDITLNTRIYLDRSDDNYSAWQQKQNHWWHLLPDNADRDSLLITRRFTFKKGMYRFRNYRILE